MSDNAAAILSLLASLTDKKSSLQQIKINEYLTKAVSCRLTFMVFTSPQEEVLMVFTLGDKILSHRVKLKEDIACFSQPIREEKPIQLTDLTPKQRKELFSVIKVLHFPDSALASRLSSSGTADQNEEILNTAFSPMKTKASSNVFETANSAVSEVQSRAVAKDIIDAIPPPNSFLCVPLIDSRTGDLEGVSEPLSRIKVLACFIDKMEGGKVKGSAAEFTEKDIQTVTECFKFILPLCLNTLDYETELKISTNRARMLGIAENLFAKLDNVSSLLNEIMTEARMLTDAERCSLFLKDEEKQELQSIVFDGGEAMMKFRLSLEDGIAGQVATTGKLENIKNAYDHPKFCKRVDEETGFKTKHILCFPIFAKDTKEKSNQKIIGVAQLCNKKTGHAFTKFDEQFSESFGVFCGIALSHSLLYNEIKTAHARNKLSNELLLLHMQVDKLDVEALKNVDIPKPSDLHADFTAFKYFPRLLPDEKTPLAVVAMIQDLGLIEANRLSRATLAKFVLMVRKGYRDPPYHNWTHAYSVTHFMYLLLKHLKLVEKGVFDPTLAFILLISSLCHDLDHRGTNNTFQVTNDSVLASLYSSDGSVLERHHFAQALCILNTEGCNIFNDFTEEKYSKCLDHMKKIILATDLNHHFQHVEDFKKMVDLGFDKNSERHKELLVYLMMTASDLSDQTKGWDNSRVVSQLIYKEFFSQGDQEKTMGLAPIDMMDREKAFIPELQINFLQNVAMPVYKFLADLFPEVSEPYQSMYEDNRKWRIVSDSLASKKQTYKTSLEIFEEDFDCFL